MTESRSADFDLRLARARMLPGIVGVWTAIGVLGAVRRLIASDAGAILTESAADVLIGSGITFIVFALVDRLPFDRYGWRSVIISLPLLVIVALLQLFLQGLMSMHGLGPLLLARGDRALLDCIAIWAVAHTVRLLRLRRIASLQAEDLSKRLTVAQLDNLSAQLQPHFLFNALNSIAALVGEDAQRARTMIARLSDLLRLSLHSMHEREVPLADEVATVTHYVEIQRIRFEDLMSFHVDVPVECLNAAVPPFFLQPLVENAVKHGVASSPGVCRIDLRARRHFDELHVTVENDCGATPASIVEGVGLSNSRARLQTMYGTAAALLVERRDSGAVAVTIRIPFKTRRRAMTAAGELVLA